MPLIELEAAWVSTISSFTFLRIAFVTNSTGTPVGSTGTE